MAAVRSPVVVVTGASAGVGRAAARAFGRCGAAIGLVARGREGLDAARRDIERAGGAAMACPADVSDADAVEAVADAVEREFGPIDVWVNDAMVSVFSPVKEMRADEYRRVTEVTYLGLVHGTLAALRRMLPRDRGTIVQVGSALAYRSIPLQSAYCAAKHAIVGFTDSLRCELIHDRSRVHVTVVHLPALNTPQFSWSRTRMPRRPQPVPPIYQPEVAAEAIVWAAHHRRREIWLGWPTVGAIVANKLAPGLLDRYLGRTGYESQQYDGEVPPGRRDNLYEPVAGDHGTRGDFDARAHARSSELAFVKHRGWVGIGALASTIAGVAVAWAAGARRRGTTASE